MLAPEYDLSFFRHNISENLPELEIKNIVKYEAKQVEKEEEPFWQTSWFMWTCITLTGAVTGTATMNNLGDVTIATVSGVGNVITADIADGAVTTIKIADDAVTGAKIADDAIDSNHYAADSIDEEHMADDAIGSVQMKSLSTLLIINSAGTTVKTLHGAGA
jgi:hypothetical protein